MVSLTNPEQPLLNNREGNDRDQERHCVLRIFQLETRVDNSMVDLWATDITKLIEHYSKGEYVTLYRYVGNLTPPTPAPLSCYIPLAECFNVMVLHERTYCKKMLTIPRPLTQLLEDTDLAAKYFLPQHLDKAKELAAQANAQPQQPQEALQGSDLFLRNLPSP